MKWFLTEEANKTLLVFKLQLTCWAEGRKDLVQVATPLD